MNCSPACPASCPVTLPSALSPLGPSLATYEPKSAVPAYESQFACSLHSGALAGSITGVLTTPLDVIKTRLMTQGSKRTYSNVFDCASKIAQQEGYATFLQVGYLPLTTHTSVAAVTPTSYVSMRPQSG